MNEIWRIAPNRGWFANPDPVPMNVIEPASFSVDAGVGAIAIGRNRRLLACSEHDYAAARPGAGVVALILRRATS
jgi:hypothetical protein